MCQNTQSSAAAQLQPQLQLRCSSDVARQQLCCSSAQFSCSSAATQLLLTCSPTAAQPQFSCSAAAARPQPSCSSTFGFALQALSLSRSIQYASLHIIARLAGPAFADTLQIGPADVRKPTQIAACCICSLCVRCATSTYRHLAARKVTMIPTRGACSWTTL